jgi:predicted house-cleaning NTP pyrophosphatase (Maf/HAM1 superfamily)
MIDESRKAHETPEQLVLRLAQEKAFEVAKTRSGLIMIWRILKKPPLEKPC